MGKDSGGLDTDTARVLGRVEEGVANLKVSVDNLREEVTEKVAGLENTHKKHVDACWKFRKDRKRAFLTYGATAVTMVGGAVAWIVSMLKGE